jgi:hypothetical protein
MLVTKKEMDAMKAQSEAQRKAILAATCGHTAGIESEICPKCEGKGEYRTFVMYVGCLTKGCERCCGSGRVAKRQPQNNK